MSKKEKEYKKLENFQTIFVRDDFNYVSDNKNIENVQKIILYDISNPNGQEPIDIALLEKFLSNLTAFYNWIRIKKNILKDIPNGYGVIREELQRCIRLFSEPKFKRISISKREYNKFNKNFLYGLSKLLSGIREAFDPNNIGYTNIDRESLVRHLFNNVEGLGRRFLFNKKGAHAFANKIWDFTMDELKVISRLLIRPGNNVRTINKWRDLGGGEGPVRILCEGNKVYFLYHANEHPIYEKQLETSPDEAKMFSTE